MSATKALFAELNTSGQLGIRYVFANRVGCEQDIRFIQRVMARVRRPRPRPAGQGRGI